MLLGVNGTISTSGIDSNCDACLDVWSFLFCACQLYKCFIVVNNVDDLISM